MMLRCSRKSLSVVVALLVLLVCAGGARADEPPYFAVTNVRIVPVSGPVIEGGTVVIAKGLITAVGKDAKIPPEAWVIDGKGLTIYPGLIDAMTDIGLQSTAAREPQGQSSSQPSPPAQPQRLSRGPEDRPSTSPWQNAADDLNAEDKRIEIWRNSGFTTALTVSRSGIFSGQGAVINLAGERSNDMVVKTPAVLGINFQPSGGFFGFPGSLMGVLSYVKQLFLDSNHYGQIDPIYNGNPRGQELPAYDRAVRSVREAVASGRPVLLPGNTAAEILRALNMSEWLSVRTILYGGQQGYEVADALASKKVPVLISLKWPEKDRNGDPDAEESLRVLKFRDRAPSTPATLEKAGVKFSFYSDGIANPKEILKNAKRAIDAGLDPDAALRAFTLNAAEIFGLSEQLGSIEPGKVANLIVADGDLFGEKTKIKVVFVNGHKYEVREPGRPTEPPTINATGKWTLTANTRQGTQTTTADLTMSPDGTLSGTVTGQSGTSSITTGWVSANKFSFTVILNRGGGAVEATYTGTIENDQMKGSVSLGSFTVDFTGMKPNTNSGLSEWLETGGEE
jgi:hypothetical protein